MKKVIVFSVALVLAASSAWAFRGGCGMGAGSGMNPYFASTLGLTEDQKAQIQLKQQAFQEEIGPLRDRLFSTKMELRNLWAEANPDQAKITAKQKQIQSLQAQIEEKGTQYQLECRQILTAEQQEKLGTAVSYRGGWGGAGRKMRGGLAPGQRHGVERFLIIGTRTGAERCRSPGTDGTDGGRHEAFSSSRHSFGNLPPPSRGGDVCQGRPALAGKRRLGTRGKL